MSAYRFWTLTCDECGEISDGGMDMTKREAKQTARNAGWKVTFGGNRDLCRECKP